MWPSASKISVLGNPENRRVRMFCEATERLDLQPPRVIAYEDALRPCFDPLRHIQPGDLVRIESPGENAAVEQALVALGAAHMPQSALPANYRPGEPVEFGRIYHPRLWYRGFCVLLETWEHALDPLPVRWMNHPADIRLAFDKIACQEHLDVRGIPVPRRLGAVANYEDLRATMRQAGESRVFLKLAHGSSASGVVAMRANGQRVSAITSAEMVSSGSELRLYNSLRVREYHDEHEVAALVDALCPLGVHLEQWVPKATGSEGAFDLRMLAIAGEVRHVVMRTSRGPITNLHLGNRRGDLASLIARLPDGAFQAACQTCRRVAASFPRSLYLAIDLMFTPKFRRHLVLEVNAFGDLLPGVLSDGLDAYAAELLSVGPRPLAETP